MVKWFGVALLALAFIAGGLVHAALAEFGTDLGFSDLVYWSGDGKAISYGAFSGGIIWRPEHTTTYTETHGDTYAKAIDPGNFFIWVNYIAPVPGEAEDPLPPLKLGGVGYDLWEFGGFTVAPELGGVFRGSTEDMHVGVEGGIRLYYDQAPVMVRAGGGYIPPDGKFALFKVALALP